MSESHPTGVGEVTRLADSEHAQAALARAKVAYTDLDGTLLGRGGCLLCDGEGRPTLAGAEAVADINEAGLPVVLVSGRTVPMLKEIVRILGWQDFIAEMGCVRGYGRGTEIVYDLGAWPELTTAGGQTPYRVIEQVGAIDALFEAFPGTLEYHTPHHEGREATHLLRGGVDAAAAQAVLDALPDAGSIPITILDNGVINPPATSLVGVQTVHAYHVVPSGTSKLAAIMADLERRGLTPDDAVMIGDSPADMAVHEAVSLVVLVNNALRSESVREQAPSNPKVVVVQEAAGAGWAEFAAAWIAARS